MRSGRENALVSIFGILYNPHIRKRRNGYMYELERLGAQSWYINCPAKIGIYQPSEDGVYLIDSGNDKDTGRKVRQILQRQNWKLLAILNTHSNADHIGGNRYLQSQTGCRVYASGIEAAFTRHPVLEPSFLYGGYPCQDLRHKFLLAQGSEVTDFSDPGFPAELEVIPLPGHFFDMVGFRLPDGTVFLADCLSSRETLEKYGVPFIYDVEAYLHTLEQVAVMEAAVFVPAHAEVSDSVAELAGYNREKVLEIADNILSICTEPIPFEYILQKIFQKYGLTMTFEQYALVGSTVRSFLSWLKDIGKVKADVKDSLLLWQRV